MRSIDLTAVSWRKSSHSNSDGGECLEVSDGFPSLVPVRDSKFPQGPALLIPASDWTAFVRALQGGRLDA